MHYVLKLILIIKMCKSLNYIVPAGRKISGRTAPESAWTDDCKHRAVFTKNSTLNSFKITTSGHIQRYN